MFGAASLEAQCSALMGAITHAEGDVAAAALLASRARRIATEHDLGRTPGRVVVHARARSWRRRRARWTTLAC